MVVERLGPAAEVRENMEQKEEDDDNSEEMKDDSEEEGNGEQLARNVLVL